MSEYRKENIEKRKENIKGIQKRDNFMDFSSVLILVSLKS